MRNCDTADFIPSERSESREPHLAPFMNAKRPREQERPEAVQPTHQLTAFHALTVFPQNRSNASVRSAAIASADRPSICQRSSMNTTSPSLIRPIDGELGGYPVK